MSHSSNLPLFNTFHSLDARIQTHFLPLCQPLPVANIPILQKQLEDYLRGIRSALKQNEFLDISTAELITDRLLELLAHYGQYTEPQRATIVGATYYFTKDDDAEHDTHSLLGFDDDVVVLNRVLEVLGHNERKIQL